MPLLTLIRHASTDWNEQGRIQGHADIPISYQGNANLQTWVLPRDIRLARWFSSPLARATQTATALGVDAEPEQRLIEMNWGDWEGESLQNLRARHGESMQRNESLGLDFCPPAGESPRMVQERIKPWLAAVGKMDLAVVAVTHRGVIRAVTALATGWDMTGKEKHKMRPGTGRQFNISSSGRPVLVEPDISFVE